MTEHHTLAHTFSTYGSEGSAVGIAAWRVSAE